MAGAYAIYANGTIYENNFSSISQTMQGPDIVNLFRSQMVLGVEKKAKIASTKIKLDVSRNTQRFYTHL